MSRRNNQLVRIHTGNYISVYGNKDMSIVYSKFDDTSTRLDSFTYKDSSGDGKLEIAYWGDNNLLPYKREEIIKDNNIVPELIATKRGIILGQGLQTYTVSYVDGKKKRTLVDAPPEIKDFLEETDWEQYALIATGELLKHGNLFPEFVMNKAKNKILSFKAHYTKNIRAGKQNTKGKIKKYYWHGSWETDNPTVAKPQPIAVWDKEKPEALFLLHLGDPLFFDGYYYYPGWWGGKEWIELSNIIPKWQKANLDNGYSIRFHIRIPKDYFLDKVAWNSAQDQKGKDACINAAVEKEKEFMEEMNRFLSGVDGAGRAVFTKYEIIEQVQKAYPGIEIIPIKADLKDEALLKLFEKSNDANISGQGIHPSLASIQVQGKMSAGSEIRNALLSYIAIKTPNIRKLILKPLYLAKKINGWDENIEFGFEDIEIEKLDENKSGQATKLQGQNTEE